MPANMVAKYIMSISISFSLVVADELTLFLLNFLPNVYRFPLLYSKRVCEFYMCVLMLSLRRNSVSLWILLHSGSCSRKWLPWDYSF